MALSQVIAQVNKFRCTMVEITGGEPLIQEGTAELATNLLRNGFQVLVETNGSLNIDQLDRRCSRIMDIKCPSSGEQSRNDPENLHRLTPNDQVKFVIGDKDDFHFAAEMLPRLPDIFPTDRILFSPVVDLLDSAQLARWMLEARLKTRLQVQLHKVIWPNQSRGV